jgi:uncharacterized membrane protein
MDKDEVEISSVEKKLIRFRWRYVLLPAVLLILSLILALIFFGKLPGDTGWTFGSDGTPNRWAGRVLILLWGIGVQVLLFLVSAGLTRGIAEIYNRYADSNSGVVSPGAVISLMGNMVALPQVIIFFALVDIFSYNSYQTHFLPLWLNAVIVLVTGGIILGIFFLRAGLRVWRANKE